MSAWRRLDSPKFAIPLELREVTEPGHEARVWEVQELRTGSIFKVTLTGRTQASGGAPLGRPLTEVEMERAVCLTVEEAMTSPPDKEPGETYEVSVSGEHLYEAALLTG